MYHPLSAQYSRPSLFRKFQSQTIAILTGKPVLTSLQQGPSFVVESLRNIACHSDHHNNKYVGSAHYPRIIMAAAVILKERNREWVGVQSLISLLLFSSRVQKQVNEPYVVPICELIAVQYCSKSISVSHVQ